MFQVKNHIGKWRISIPGCFPANFFLRRKPKHGRISKTVRGKNWEVSPMPGNLKIDFKKHWTSAAEAYGNAVLEFVWSANLYIALLLWMSCDLVCTRFSSHQTQTDWPVWWSVYSLRDTRFLLQRSRGLETAELALKQKEGPRLCNDCQNVAFVCRRTRTSTCCGREQLGRTWPDQWTCVSVCVFVCGETLG